MTPLDSMRMDIVLFWEKNFRVVGSIVPFWEYNFPVVSNIVLFGNTFLDSYCQINCRERLLPLRKLNSVTPCLRDSMTPLESTLTALTPV